MTTRGFSVGVYWAYKIQDFGYFNYTGITKYDFFNLRNKRV